MQAYVLYLVDSSVNNIAPLYMTYPFYQLFPMLDFFFFFLSPYVGLGVLHEVASHVLKTLSTPLFLGYCRGIQ